MSIRINVDPTNPGQFFACCGLLELADRLWPTSGVQGAFATDQFQLFADTDECSLRHILERFVAADLQQLDGDDNAAPPLYLGHPFELRLDWWTKYETPNKRRIDLGGGDQLKTWAGKQCGPLIFRMMRNACADIDLQAPFDDVRAIYNTKNGAASKKTISPFCFDARRDGTSLDFGFSPDEQEMSVVTYPAVEALALVGLQRFRPSVDENGRIRTFIYTAWADPLPSSAAMAAVSGKASVRACGAFRFTKPSRGGEYLTMFSRATRVRSNNV